ncbi:hypothetical protein Tco_0542797 [Tanacetum coccineum]
MTTTNKIHHSRQAVKKSCDDDEAFDYTTHCSSRGDENGQGGGRAVAHVSLEALEMNIPRVVLDSCVYFQAREGEQLLAVSKIDVRPLHILKEKDSTLWL